MQLYKIDLNHLTVCLHCTVNKIECHGLRKWLLQCRYCPSLKIIMQDFILKCFVCSFSSKLLSPLESGPFTWWIWWKRTMIKRRALVIDCHWNGNGFAFLWGMRTFFYQKFSDFLCSLGLEGIPHGNTDRVFFLRKESGVVKLSVAQILQQMT